MNRLHTQARRNTPSPLRQSEPWIGRRVANQIAVFPKVGVALDIIRSLTKKSQPGIVSSWRLRHFKNHRGIPQEAVADFLYIFKKIFLCFFVANSKTLAFWIYLAGIITNRRKSPLLYVYEQKTTGTPLSGVIFRQNTVFLLYFHLRKRWISWYETKLLIYTCIKSDQCCRELDWASPDSR